MLWTCQSDNILYAEIFHTHNTQDKMRAFLDTIHKSFLYIYFHFHENESFLLLLALLVEIKRRYFSALMEPTLPPQCLQ